MTDVSSAVVDVEDGRRRRRVEVLRSPGPADDPWLRLLEPVTGRPLTRVRVRGLDVLRVGVVGGGVVVVVVVVVVGIGVVVVVMGVVVVSDMVCGFAGEEMAASSS